MKAPTLYELIICGIALVILTKQDMQYSLYSILYKLYTLFSLKFLLRSFCGPLKDGRISSPIVCLVLALAAVIEPDKDFFQRLYGVALGFIPLFLVARFGGGGDGDALVCGTIGFVMPLRFTAYFLLFTSTVYVIVLAIVKVITKNKTKQLVYMPFVSLGFVAAIVYSILTTGVTI